MNRLNVHGFFLCSLVFAISTFGNQITTIFPSQNDLPTTTLASPAFGGTVSPGVAQVRVNGFSAIVNQADGTWTMGSDTPTWNTVVPANATWTYRDLGTEPPANWAAADFTDTWPSGPAPIGYGEAGLATTVSFGPNANDKYPATFFRTTFNVADPSNWVALELILEADDGAVVYLNGEPVLREHMPKGYHDWSTYAVASVSGRFEQKEVRRRIAADAVRPGLNVLAVELHQFDATSSDIWLKAELRAMTTPTARLELNPGMNVLSVDFLDRDGRVIEYQKSTLRYDTGAFSILTGTANGDVTLTAAAGPYRVTEDYLVTGNLRIGPGATVFFDEFKFIDIDGILLMTGNQWQRIWVGPTPGVTTKQPQMDAVRGVRLDYVDWNGVGAPPEEGGETRNGEPAIDADDVFIVEHCTFSPRQEDLFEVVNCEILFRHNEVAPLFGEPPQRVRSDKEIFEGGGSFNNYFILEDNVFGRVYGNCDVVDTAGGALPGKIVEIRDNVFYGSNDEIVDGRGDYVFEGNTVFNIGNPSARFGGNSNVMSIEGSSKRFQFTRNTFVGIQHLINNVNDCFAWAEHNTIVRVDPDPNTESSPITLFVDADPEKNYFSGRGAYLSGNVWQNFPSDIFGRPDDNNTVSVLQVDGDLVDSANAFSNADGQFGRAFDYTVGTAIYRDPGSDDYSLELGSPGSGAGRFGLDLGAGVPRGVQVSGEPEWLTRSRSANLTVGGPGIFSYLYRLDDGPWVGPVSIQDPTAVGQAVKVRTVQLALNNLPDGEHTVTLRGADLSGRLQPELRESKTWTVSSTPLVRLSEISIAGDACRSVGFVELLNAGPTPQSVAAYTISNGAETFTLSAGSVIPADGLLAVSWPHGGTEITLSDAGGVALDALRFGPQAAGSSLARVGERQTWSVAVPSPNRDNLAGTLGSSGLRIASWLLNDPNASVELVNTGSLPADLSGVYLSDNRRIPDAGALAPFTVIAPGAWLQLPLASIGLRPELTGGELVLFSADGTILDLVSYGDQAPGQQVSAGLIVPAAANQAPVFLDAEEGDCTLPAPTLLKGFGTAWRYLDNGSNQGLAWRNPGFDDAAWPTGNAQFGYGDGDETTVVSFGGDPDNKHLTTYFRSTFSIANPQNFERVEFELLFDDGAIVYLNGFEIGRPNMPAGQVLFNTPAANGGENSTDLLSADASLLVAGINTIAVEVHQDDPDSSDISFDLALRGVAGPNCERIIPVNAVAGQLFTFLPAVEDPDDCGSLLFAFEAPVPAGVTMIDPATGLIQFTPSLAGTIKIPVRVSDPQGEIDRAIVTVSVVNPNGNDVPVVAPVDDQATFVGTAVTVQVNASDAGVLRYELGSPWKPGMSLNAQTGLFSWTPLTPGTCTVVLLVRDNGMPSLARSVAFEVEAAEAPLMTPIIDSALWQNGNALVFQTEANTTYVIETCTDLVQANWEDLQTIVGDGNLQNIAQPSVILAPDVRRYYRIRAVRL